MADGIIFSFIPGSGLTEPTQAFEENSGGQYEMVDRYVLLGHANATGLIAPNTPTPVSSQDVCDQQAGPGSMLREMFRVAQANAAEIPIWIVAVPDVGVAPVWTLALGELPGVGVGTFEVCGEEIEIAVGSTDTPTTVAAAIAAAINAYYDPLSKAMLPVTATSSSANVTVTSRHKGAIMNAVDFYVPTSIAGNLFAAAGVWSLTRTTSGSGSPVVAGALAALGDNPADFVVSPWTDGASLSSYTTALNDVAGRWAWSRQSYGHVWTAQANSFAGLITQGLALNDRHMTVIGKIAGVAAAGAVSFTEQPTAGQTVTIDGSVVEFVASGATGLQVAIGGSETASVAALLAFLQGSADPGLSKCSYGAVGTSEITVTAIQEGQGGNAITLATNVTGATVSGATLTGGLNGSPHPSWLWAAGFSARAAPWLSDTTTGNVARNQTGLVVQGLAPPRDPSLWPDYSGRNQLVNSGISTWTAGADGSVQISKIVTTYQTGVGGQPDTVFRDVQAPYQVAGAFKFLRALCAEELANKSLAASNPGNLGAIATPSDVQATFTNGYGQLVLNGVLQDLAGFAKRLRVAINGQNPDRCDVLAPMARVNPFDILAVNAIFYQQFPQGT